MMAGLFGGLLTLGLLQALLVTMTAGAGLIEGVLVQAPDAFGCFNRSTFDAPGPQPILQCDEGQRIQVTNYRFVYEPKGCETDTPSPDNNCAKSSATLLAANRRKCNGERSCTSTYLFSSSVEREVLPAVTSSCRINGSLSSGSGGWTGVTVDYACESTIRAELVDFCSTQGSYPQAIILQSNGRNLSSSQGSSGCECEISVKGTDNVLQAEVTECGTKDGSGVTLTASTGVPEEICTGRSTKLEPFKDARFKLAPNAVHALQLSVPIHVVNQLTQISDTNQLINVVCTTNGGSPVGSSQIVNKILLLSLCVTLLWFLQ